MANAPLILPTNEEPSMWNRDTAVGAVVGSLIFPLVGVPVGALVGGMMGKSRMEEEKARGKVVSEPSFWNKDTFIGAGIGNMVGGAVAVATVVAAPVIGLSALGALAVAGTLGLGGIVAGAYLGGRSGEERLQSEYNQAQTYARASEKSSGIAKIRETSVTPEEARELEARLRTSANREIKFTEQVRGAQPTLQAQP